MSISQHINFIIYRIREKGLEVFLLSREQAEGLEIPKGHLEDESHNLLYKEDRLIELDSVKSEDGNIENACAIEGDWHDIPSLKGMINEDFHIVKDKIESILPELEKGTFIAVKEAFKKVLPHQYAFLKELKEIVSDRNSVKDI